MLPAAWCLLAGVFLSLALAFIACRQQFDWARELAEIPARGLALGLVAAGLAFLAVLPLVRATLPADADLQRRILGLVVAVGVLLRLLMWPVEPALEDDQQRYLWEGALVAHGLSPYAIAPNDAKSADRDIPLGQLAEHAGAVLDRVNHPHLKTIYPPVAQAAFVLAYAIEPFSLTAWRVVLLAAEAATLLLLLALLRDGGQAPIWVALYWWNPIPIKEIANSGHMEGVLTPLVLAAVLLGVRRRPVAAMGALGLAVGVKIWPLLLAPLLLRPWFDRPRVLVAALAMLGGLMMLWAVPVVLGGLDQRSGFVAYSRDWQAVSALLPALRSLVRGVLDPLGFAPATAGLVTRAGLAGVAALGALALAWRATGEPIDLLRRAALITLVLVLVSPAQFPWYMLWTIAFLPFAPRAGVMLMAVLLPLYYVSFYLSAIDAYAVFRDRVVWLIWLPIWTALAVEAVTGRGPDERQPG